MSSRATITDTAEDRVILSAGLNARFHDELLRTVPHPWLRHGEYIS